MEYQLFDISQEVFSCNVYPGDPKPVMTPQMRISEGAVCNLSALSMCAHNGTHVDAPFHFLQDGKTIDRIPLDHFTGDCFLARHEGDVSGEDAKEILRKAEAAGAALAKAEEQLRERLDAWNAANNIRIVFCFIDSGIFMKCSSTMR